MSIPDRQELGKKEGTFREALSRIPRDWVFGAIILLSASLCLGLGIAVGKESASKGDSLWIEQLPAEEQGSSTTVSSSKEVESLPPTPAAAAAALSTTGTYVASKTGSKYYLPSCSGAKRIKDENKVWFRTKTDAEKAGYEPASTCKGL